MVGSLKLGRGTPWVKCRGEGVKTKDFKSIFLVNYVIIDIFRLLLNPNSWNICTLSSQSQKLWPSTTSTELTTSSLALHPITLFLLEKTTRIEGSVHHIHFLVLAFLCTLIKHFYSLLWSFLTFRCFNLTWPPVSEWVMYVSHGIFFNILNQVFCAQSDWKIEEIWDKGTTSSAWAWSKTGFQFVGLDEFLWNKIHETHDFSLEKKYKVIQKIDFRYKTPVSKGSIVNWVTRWNSEYLDSISSSSFPADEGKLLPTDW